MRAGVNKTARKSQNTCGKHQPGNGQRRQANAEGQHRRDHACHKRRAARAKAVDNRARHHIAHRGREVAHERDGGDQKGGARQIIRSSPDKPQKVHRVVGAPLQGLNKNQPDFRRRQAHCFAILREHTNSFIQKGMEGAGLLHPFARSIKRCCRLYASTPKNAPTMPTTMVATISTMGLIFLDSSQ